MSNNSPFAFLFISSIFLHLILVNCKTPLAPALYVFGDSLSDSGNNNYLRNTAKANYQPYGVDFPSGIPTGRFSNGKTSIDYIAQFLGLPLVPAYLGLSISDKRNITTGVNYASGGAGILPETGNAIGEILSLAKQINYFKRTIRCSLSKTFKTRSNTLSKHLAKSIFYVSLGSNDYINNYLQPANYNSSLTYTPQQFADCLLDSLKQSLEKLYKMGGRKFAIFNIPRVGCVPGLVNAFNLPPTIACVEDVNNLALLYNANLPNMIKAIAHKLLGSTFVHGDLYSMNQSSAEAGFGTRQIPCCEYSATSGLCLQDSTPCPMRSMTLFWDAYHPTEIVNSAQATDCFSGIVSCVPINIQQLALKRGLRSRFHADF
ncbi:hypothetical protein ACHQM5_006753 [Ranunculus cassubicifolius]